VTAPLLLNQLSFAAIAAVVAERPTLLVPVAALEPIGDLPLGVVPAAASAVAHAVSASNALLCAPLFTFGFATPFKAFAGPCGLHAATVESALYGIAADAALWGIREIVFIDGSTFSSPMIAKAVKRINGLVRGQVKASSYSWTSDAKIRALLDGALKGSDPIRPEAALLALAAYHDSSFSSLSLSAVDTTPDVAVVKSWKKRGRDPEQFRKYFPTCRTGVLATSGDPALGAELCTLIAASLSRRIAAAAGCSGKVIHADP